MSKLSWVVSIAVVLMAASWSVPSAQAQDDDMPKCAHDLNPCGPFINSTTAKPPATCCTLLVQALQDELPCICNILSNVDLIQALSLNVSEAVTLPKRCDIKFDLVSECQALLAPAMAPSPASDSLSLAPAAAPSTSTGTNGEKKKSAASELSKIGSVLGTALLLMTTMMFY